MVGIYNDSFIIFLKDYLGDNVKITQKNIITRCPFCEMNSNKKHFHLYISLEAPVFHCFNAACPSQKGGRSVKKLVKKINSGDANLFIDKNLLKEPAGVKGTVITTKKIKIPDLDPDRFKLKTMYVQKRMKTFVALDTIKGLVFDIDKFLIENSLVTDELRKYKDYLQSNFIGFLTENRSILVMRNIEENSRIRYHKIQINDLILPDYYSLSGDDNNSNMVILAEGIFDIAVERNFDSINKKSRAKMYAAALSTHYDSVIKSLAFYENMYRQDINILSDKGIDLKFYSNLKKRMSHIIESMTVYYNVGGKDFGEGAIKIEKIII